MDWQSLWQVLQPYLAGQLRHLLTVAAGSLITWGALQQDQQNQFVTIASGIVIWAIGATWSWLQKRAIPKLKAELERQRAVKRPLTSEVVRDAMAAQNKP